MYETYSKVIEVIVNKPPQISLSYRKMTKDAIWTPDQILQNQIPVYENSLSMINDELSSLAFVCVVYSNPISFVTIQDSCFLLIRFNLRWR